MQLFKRCAQEPARRRHRWRPRARARRRGRKRGHDGADEDAAEAGRQGCPVTRRAPRADEGPEGRQRPEGRARAARPAGSRAGPTGPRRPRWSGRVPQVPQGPAGACRRGCAGGVRRRRMSASSAATPRRSRSGRRTRPSSARPSATRPSGTFRFTCNAAQAPCRVSVVAKVLSDTSVATGKVYPRVLIYRGGDPDSVVTPEFYCEYGDGPFDGRSRGRRRRTRRRRRPARCRSTSAARPTATARFRPPVRSPRSWCRRASTTSLSTFVFTTA